MDLLPQNIHNIMNLKPLELESWNFERMFTMCHVSCVTRHVSRVTCHLSRVTCHLSCVTCHMSRVTCQMYFFFIQKKKKKKKTCDTWHVTRDMWHVTGDTWHVTRDTWHVTRDRWHLTCDMFGGVNILSKFQLPSSYRLWFMILWRSGGKGSLT